MNKFAKLKAVNRLLVKIAGGYPQTNLLVQDYVGQRIGRYNVASPVLEQRKRKAIDRFNETPLPMGRLFPSPRVFTSWAMKYPRTWGMTLNMTNKPKGTFKANSLFLEQRKRDALLRYNKSHTLTPTYELYRKGQE